MENKELSLGEKIVRTSFNASNDSVVQHIKEQAADFINYLNNNLVPSSGYSEKNNDMVRCKDKAIDLIELAAMMAVKAATA